MDRQELIAISREPNVAAFLRVIRACEGTAADNGYEVTFGYEPITDLSDHPRRKIRRNGYVSTAAGAYQFIEDTWDEMAAKYGLPDFSPESQDAAAVGLLIRANALDVIRAGRLEEAIARTNRTWASLPGSPYGQPVRTLDFCRRVFAMYGGREAGIGAPAAAPVAAPVAAPIEGYKPMAPVVAALLPTVIQLIPELGKLFGSGSKVADRNIAAAEVVAGKVAEVVTAATEAPNLQGAVESMQADPAKLEAARAAVRREWFDLESRSLADARKFVTEYGQTKNVRTVAGKFTFPELLSLVFIGMASLGVGYLMVTRQLSGELLGGVVTLMLIGGWTEIRKFWFGLGSPDGEQPRREP
jgi:muramidase (phage lysozyme)